MLRPSLSDGSLVLYLARNAQVSPELMLRPSLSAHREARPDGQPQVSPELMLRPSLSAVVYLDPALQIVVSPELMLRPSLSGRGWKQSQHPY